MRTTVTSDSDSRLLVERAMRERASPAGARPTKPLPRCQRRTLPRARPSASLSRAKSPFSTIAIELHGKASSTEEQQQWVLDHIRKPIVDAARSDRIYDEVRSLADAYVMPA